jgi:hypothetical protein
MSESTLTQHPIDRALGRTSGIALGQLSAHIGETVAKLSRRQRQTSTSSSQADIDQQVVDVLAAVGQAVAEEAWRRDMLATQAKAVPDGR